MFLSLLESQFLYSRTDNTLSAFLESDIKEENEVSSDDEVHDHLQESDSNFTMPVLDDINSGEKIYCSILII